MDRFATPRDLAEALHHGDRAAREQLRDLIRQPLARLMESLIVRHQLQQDREVLLLHALHTAETTLRVRPAEAFEGLTWTSLRASLLIQVGKLAQRPFGGSPGGPMPLPPSRTYFSQTLFRPYERMGDHWFGGDWYAGIEGPDGAYWVVLADVTGHGYHAYLLAAGLPAVWQHCWDLLHAGTPLDVQPADLLQLMHELLADCLPEGIFLECSLTRLSPDGGVTVGAAGATRLLVHRGGPGGADEHRLRGAWLGLNPPRRSDQRRWELAPGDELLLATDGLYDQIDGNPLFAAELVGEGGLLERVSRVLDQALARGPQRDDITLVLLRRRTEGPEDVRV